MVKKLRLKWIGQVRRMPHARLPKRVLSCELTVGKRNVGGAPQRWKDVVRRDMDHFGISHLDWWDRSSRTNKSEWRSCINKAAKVWEGKRVADAIKVRIKRKEKEAKRESKQARTGRHKCPLCVRRYETSSSLFRHIKALHPDHEPSKYCDACKRNFKNRSGKTRHKCKPKPSLTCTVCQRTFTTQSGKGRHICKLKT